MTTTRKSLIWVVLVVGVLGIGLVLGTAAPDDDHPGGDSCGFAPNPPDTPSGDETG